MIDTKRLMNPGRSVAEAQPKPKGMSLLQILLQIVVRINPVYALIVQTFIALQHLKIIA